MNAYSMHTDPHNFSPSPSSFLPERWLPKSDPRSLCHAPGYAHNEAAFMPFSIGPMNCVGKSLAMQEMKTVLCAVLQRFKVRAEDGWDPRTYEGNYRDYFTAQRPELPVVLEVR